MMNIALVPLVALVALTLPASAQTDPGPFPAANAPGGDATKPAAHSFAETSVRRQATFDKRIAQRGERAIASLCRGCGIGTERPTRRVPGKTGRRIEPVGPDAESVYSSRHGFDPSQAWDE